MKKEHEEITSYETVSDMEILEETITTTGTNKKVIDDNIYRKMAINFTNFSLQIFCLLFLVGFSIASPSVAYGKEFGNLGRFFISQNTFAPGTDEGPGSKATEGAIQSKPDVGDIKSSIYVHEDENNHYYELRFSGVKKEDIGVGIDNEILTFSTANKIVNTDQKSPSSNLVYSILLGEYDKTKQVDIKKQDEKIIVKLSKKKPLKN
jgi:HSP20 family molecular chaperone IbpA